LERGATLADSSGLTSVSHAVHPDITRAIDAAAQFRQISRVRDADHPDRRRATMRRRVDTGERAPSFGFEGFDFTISVHGDERRPSGLSPECCTARGAPADAEASAVDLHQSMTLSFEDAMRGVSAA